MCFRSSKSTGKKTTRIRAGVLCGVECAIASQVQKEQHRKRLTNQTTRTKKEALQSKRSRAEEEEEGASEASVQTTSKQRCVYAKRAAPINLRDPYCQQQQDFYNRKPKIYLTHPTLPRPSE